MTSPSQDSNSGGDRAPTRRSPDLLLPRLEGILDRINDLVLLVEADGTLSYWNSQASARLGDPARSPLGLPLTDLIHPEDRPRIHEVILGLFLQGVQPKSDDPRDLRVRMITREGKWVFCFVRPSLYLPAGTSTPVCLFIVREDVERRKLVPWQEKVQELREEVESKTRRLAESESDYRALIEAMNDGFCVLDTVGRVLFVNEKLADLLGYPQARLIGREAADLFDEPNRRIFFTQLRERSLGRLGTYEIDFIRQDGSRITCLMRAAPRYDPAGNHLGSICNVTDISTRKKLEDLLSTSEKNYRDLFENMQDVICRMNPDGQIISINPAGVWALGWERPEDMLRAGLPSFFERQEEWDQLQAELKDKGGVKDFVVRLRRRDGASVVVSVNAQLVLDESGTPAGIDAVFRDVTERMRMEAQLESYARDMEKKNDELEGLIYSITHDLKSPLMVVGGLLGRLRKASSAALVAKRQEYLPWMQQSVHKMERMVNDLLLFYKADKAVRTEPVSLGPVVETVLRDAEPLAREKGIRLRKEGAFPVVRGYRNSFYRVFYNLVENAIKFMDRDEGAEVEVGCREEGGEHLFYVLDNGPGIAPEHRAKVFQIFYTLEPESASGTGIGLSIVKKIVESHGGRVWLESEVGKGTTFFFTLAGPAAV